jgi:type IV pilus assembly protein PilC
MKFDYKASTIKGKLKKGTIEAKDRKEAKAKLEEQGFLNVILKSAELEKTGFANVLYLKRLSLIDRLTFTKNLSVMIKAGMTIDESLRSLRDQATKPLIKRILKRVVSSVEAGQSLADSLAMFPRQFNKIFINIIRTGEESGNLEENLKQLAIQLEKDNTLRRRIKSAMMYPIIVLVTAFVIGMSLALFVLPRVTKIFKQLDVEPPLATRILLVVADFLQDYGVFVFIGLFALIIFTIWLGKRKFMHPIVHPIYLNIPAFGKIVLNINLARFCRTLGTLLKSGIPISQSLEILYDTMENSVFKKSIKEFKAQVAEGVTLADTLEKYPKVYPVLVSKMVSVGEKTGDLEGILLYLAEFYEAEVEVSTRDLATILEPILLLIIGLIVGFVAIAIITPLYNVLGGVRAR